MLLALLFAWLKLGRLSKVYKYLLDVLHLDVVDAEPEQSLESRPIALPPIQGKIEFENVDFGNPHSPLVVKNVSFLTEPGKFIGIVGQSGSGKSTIMKLLPRMYRPKSGTIRIDDYDISKVDIDSLRRQMSIVPQDSMLFDGTVRDNIALNSPDSSDEDIVHAAKVACAHAFIMELPNGYDTRVGERGSALSGGQRQGSYCSLDPCSSTFADS